MAAVCAAWDVAEVAAVVVWDVAVFAPAAPEDCCEEMAPTLISLGAAWADAFASNNIPMLAQTKPIGSDTIRDTAVPGPLGSLIPNFPVTLDNDIGKNQTECTAHESSFIVK